jgi:hypothetical protein
VEQLLGLAVEVGLEPLLWARTSSVSGSPNFEEAVDAGVQRTVRLKAQADR